MQGHLHLCQTAQSPVQLVMFPGLGHLPMPVFLHPYIYLYKIFVIYILVSVLWSGLHGHAGAVVVGGSYRDADFETSAPHRVVIFLDEGR